MLAHLRTPAGAELLSIKATESVSSSITVDGVAISPAPPDIVVEYSGQLLMRDGDYFARLDADGDNPWVVESSRMKGATTRRFMADGWTTGADIQRLPDVLRSIEALDPVGTIVRNGRTLQRFTARTTVPIELGSLWYTDKGSGSADNGVIEILAAEDGVPIAAIVSISSDDMSIEIPDLPPPQPRRYRFELEWQNVPEDATLPGELEKLVTTDVSEHHLKIGLPADWKRQMVDGPWVWFENTGPDVYLGVARAKVPTEAAKASPESQLQGWTASRIAGRRNDLGVDPTAVESTRVGDIEGVMATYHVPAGNTKATPTQIEAMFVNGGWAYLVIWQSATPFDLIARYRFERILETVAFRD